MVAQAFSSSTWEAETGHSLVVQGQLSLQSKFKTARAVTQRSPVSRNGGSKGKLGRIWALSRESSKLVIFYPFFPTRHTEWTVRNLGKRVRWECHLASCSVFFQFTHHMADDSRMVSLLKRF